MPVVYCWYDNCIVPTRLSARGQNDTCYSSLLLIYLAKKIDKREKYQIQLTKLLQVVNTFRKICHLFPDYFTVKPLQILYKNTSLLWFGLIPNKYLMSFLEGLESLDGHNSSTCSYRYFFYGSPPFHFHPSHSCSCSDYHLPGELK